MDERPDAEHVVGEFVHWDGETVRGLLSYLSSLGLLGSLGYSSLFGSLGLSG